MRADFRVLLLAASLVLAGCKTTDGGTPATPGPVVVLPPLVEYSCAEQKTLSKVLASLNPHIPEQAIQLRVILDYYTLRMRVRAAGKLPEQSGCPP